MIGAIIGDVIGSRFERNNIKTTEFDLFTKESEFTDDTILTIAVADTILKNGNYGEYIRNYARMYPKAGYGRSFRRWFESKKIEPYNSWGNGSAMRVSPIGFYFESIEEVLEEAKKSAEVTHNHIEGIKGAQAIAVSVFLARSNKDKKYIKDFIQNKFDYDLDRKIEEIRKTYKFDVSCQGSVPESIIAFLESQNFEDAIRLSISIGGDSDTIACMCGAISEAYYDEIPYEIKQNTIDRLPEIFKDVIDKFYLKI